MKIVAALLITLAMASCDRVIDRYPDGHLPHARCLMGVPDLWVSLGEMGLNSLLGPQLRKFQRINCTIVWLDFTKLGVCVNGTYDGIAGKIQRNELDAMTYFYRFDFFDTAPGFMLSVGLPADVVIIMQKNASAVINYDLIGLWSSSFDIITVAYVLISIYLFITVLSFATRPTFSVPILLRNMSENLRRSLFAIFDQENFEARNESSRIAIFFFNLFLLFGIHGIMLGCMGSDLVSVVDHPIYESLDEFSNSSWVQPTVTSALWLLPVLEKTGPGSELWPLKQAVVAHPDKNVIWINVKDETATMQAMLQLTGEIATGKRAAIVPRFALDYCNDILCTVLPERMKDFVYSKNSFTNSVLISPMSFKIDPALRTFIEYTFMTLAETGILLGITRTIYATKIISSMPADDKNWSLNKNKCLEGFKQGTRPSSVFDMALYAPIFQQLAIACSIGLIILIIEIGVQRAEVRRKKKKRAKAEAKHEKERKMLAATSGSPDPADPAESAARMRMARLISESYWMRHARK